MLLGHCRLKSHTWIVQTALMVMFLWFMMVNVWFLFQSHQHGTIDTSHNKVTIENKMDESMLISLNNFEEIDFGSVQLAPLVEKKVVKPQQLRSSSELRELKCGRVLVAHEYIPYENHHGADSRLLDFLISLVDVCSEVRFISYTCLLGPHLTEKWEQPKAEHIDDLRSRGVKVECKATASSTSLTESIGTLLADYNPDYVIGTLWFWTWPTRPLFISQLLEAHSSLLAEESLVTTQNGHRKFIVLSDDVHGDREEDQLRPLLVKEESNKAFSGSNAVTGTSFEFKVVGTRWKAILNKEAKSSLLRPSSERLRHIKSMEKAIYSSVDAVFAITQEDKSRMYQLVDHVNIFTIRPTAPTYLKPSPATFSQRFGYVFLGSGQNPTNVAAIQWFISEVWPLIRKRIPTAHLLVGGAPPPGGSWSSQLATKEQCKRLGVTAVGFVKDINSLVAQARVFVSPVRVASGFNTKNLVALAAGLPLVTTPFGATGLVDGSAVIGQTADSFADLSVKMHEDPSLWARQRTSSLSVASSFFSPNAVRDETRSALASIASFPTKHSHLLLPISPFLVMVSNPKQ